MAGFTLPDLPYDYSALEPHIDEQTMRIHHDKHHAGYVSKLNAALEKHPQLQNKKIDELLRDIDSVPDDIRTAVRNNGGGHANHSLFWTVMKPGGGGSPSGDIANALNKMGGADGFKEKFSNAASGRFGSGWAWLVAGNGGNLEVIDLPNQDSPYMQNKTPILGLDVWEHAYYLKYQNKRPDYIQAWWNTVNWDEVNRRYQEARG